MQVLLIMNPAFELWWGAFEWDDEDWPDDWARKGADKNLLPYSFLQAARCSSDFLVTDSKSDILVQ